MTAERIDHLIQMVIPKNRPNFTQQENALSVVVDELKEQQVKAQNHRNGENISAKTVWATLINPKFSFINF